MADRRGDLRVFVGNVEGDGLEDVCKLSEDLAVGFVLFCGGILGVALVLRHFLLPAWFLGLG